MNCSEAKMLLATSAAHELAAEQHSALREHLQACASCQRTQTTILKLDGLIGAWGDAAPVRGYAAARVALPQRTRKSRLQLHLRRWKVHMPLFLSGAVVLAVLFMFFVALRPVAPITVVRPLLSRPVPAVQAPVIVSGNDRITVRCPIAPAQNTPNVERALRCQIDYVLDSTDAGIVSLRLVGGRDGQQRYFAEPQPIARGSGQLQIEATFNTERLRTTFGTAPVHIEAVLRASDTTLLASSRAPDSANYLLQP